ncbi:pyridine nucleotide-disulfide oxidoreductase [Streptomyces bambusae]|uniref:FAD-dependent monooxygenase n=1 Tax=Streptomyces bambusae TaxID=1550616 RepID=UPI001CFEE645|nr:FAD-dependent monooxygenase [Streptomyces bambusae]MCB5168933.1 pyridine nucleotide-disulfide oxidoreductase [Streptomyces bambusae]
MADPSKTERAARHAVVIGGGLAGMLAAAALAEHMDAVTVVDRDVLPSGPEPRKGLPQAHHAHLLWSGGARAIEELLPGTTARWLAAGARRIPLPTGLVSMSASGWFRRWPEMQFLIACSRDLLDWVVRREVLACDHVRMLDGTELLGLDGDAGRVTGVRIRTAAGETATLDAALVVDASGRGSRAPRWLQDLGAGEVREEEVDSGLAYASRIFRAPAGTEDFPVVNVQSDPRVPVPGQTATIIPVEGGRWLVTLSGTRGGQPTGDAAEFEAFARQVRDPVVGELIAHAKPLTDVVMSRSTVNRRRYFEELKSWPEGFVALGDAVATYNPVYGHGMSVAAQGVLALRAQLRSHGAARPGFARRVQRAVARPVATAWDLAVGQDILYPGAVGSRPPASSALLRRYMDRLMLTATGRPIVTRTLFDVMTLSAPPQALLRPEVVLAVARGPQRPPLEGPPLTGGELRFTEPTDGSAEHTDAETPAEA